MNSQIATLGCIAVIAALFMLSRDRVRTSPALWLPVAWLSIAASRNISEWLQLGSPVETVDRYLEGSPVDRNILTALLAAAIGVLITRRQRVGAVLKANTPVLAYFAYCACSIIWADYPFVALKRWIRSTGDLCMALVILTDPHWHLAIKRVLARVGFVLLPVSMLFIRYYPELGRSYGRWDGMMYWTGVAGGKNGLGMLCLVCGLGSVWRFFAAYQERNQRSRHKRMIAEGIIVLLTLWLLYIADSKTSMMCFVIAAGLMTFVSTSKLLRKPLVLNSVVGGLVAAAASVLFLGLGSGLLTTIGRDPTLTGRTDVWNLVLKFTANPIVGAGYESFWLGERLDRITALNGGINQAHNGYIEVYLNLGLIGVGLLGFLIVRGYRNVVRALRKNVDVGRFKLAFFVVGVIYNFTEGSFKMMSPVWILFLLVTVAVPDNDLVSPVEATPMKRSSEEAWWGETVLAERA
jgi:O-antigen ligase